MIQKRKLFWQFFGVHILILFISVVFISAYTWNEGRKAFKSQWLYELEMQGQLAVAMLEGSNVRLSDKSECRIFFKRLSVLDQHRFTLILPDGFVVGDSKADVEAMDSHKMRPEILQARKTGSGFQERYSATLGKKMLYVARRIPVDISQSEQAVLRVSVPMTTISKTISAANRHMAVLVIVILAATFGLSYLAALRIVGPVSDLQNGLNRIGNGEHSFRLKVPLVPHLSELVRSINQTADQIELHINELEEERNLRALILKNMDLGLIAVDTEQRIMNVNEAAIALLNVNVKQIEGSQLGEVARYPELLRFLDASEHSNKKAESNMSVDATLDGDEDRVLTMRSTALKDLHERRIGTLIILSDVTRIKKLETVRQDFVANVSHELRTPVTSIKGFAETLLDGALDEPETSRRFIGIIARQADQLEQIIHDLLELSRLEQSIDKELECHDTPVVEMLKNAVELCQHRADNNGIEIKLTCPASISLSVHAGLIEQALVNLIDNALKYGCSDDSRKIEISALCVGPSVRICVRDFGCGIEKHHLDRMFERFYRIDSGRTRELGGTGLGLAIVKHIVLIHHGSVAVESEPGLGSAFTISLPVQRT